jgi:hypothetical protein
MIFRGSIAGMMTLVFMVAVVVAALRFAPGGWRGMAVDAAVLVLLCASIQARFSRSRTVRNWCFGFALFGWAHLLLVTTTLGSDLPTSRIAEAIMESQGPKYAPYPMGAQYHGSTHVANNNFYGHMKTILQVMITMIAAIFGGALTALLFSSRGRMTRDAYGSRRG